MEKNNCSNSLILLIFYNNLKKQTKKQMKIIFVKLYFIMALCYFNTSQISDNK